MRRLTSRDRANASSHVHYTEWLRGDGVTTEFFLSHRITRFDDIEVFLNGFLYKPDVSGTTEDYKVRGLTPGYPGDSNAITFAVAPPLNWDIAVRLVST